MDLRQTPKILDETIVSIAILKSVPALSRENGTNLSSNAQGIQISEDFRILRLRENV